MEAILYKNKLLNVLSGVKKAPKTEDIPQTTTSEQRINQDPQVDAVQKFIEKNMDAIIVNMDANIVNMTTNMKSSKEVWKDIEN